jgi:uncharacterized protein YvpB
MKIDLCPNREKFYSQLNNEIDPYNTCQVTSMVAGLDIGKIGLEPILRINIYRQPEDKLKHYMENDSVVQDHWRKNYNTAIPAPEWAGVMVFAVNHLFSKKTAYYDDYLDMNDITEDLQKGLPVYTSMRDPDNKNSSGKPSPVNGHIVLIVGIDGDNLLINDPYKNHLTGAADGFKNIYTPEDFAKHNKGYAIRYRRA